MCRAMAKKIDFDKYVKLGRLGVKIKITELS